MMPHNNNNNPNDLSRNMAGLCLSPAPQQQPPPPPPALCCPVSLDLYSREEGCEPRTLGCGHTFSTCTLEMLLKNGSLVCPMCRVNHRLEELPHITFALLDMVEAAAASQPPAPQPKPSPAPRPQPRVVQQQPRPQQDQRARSPPPARDYPRYNFTGGAGGAFVERHFNTLHRGSPSPPWRHHNLPPFPTLQEMRQQQQQQQPQLRRAPSPHRHPFPVARGRVEDDEDTEEDEEEEEEYRSRLWRRPSPPPRPRPAAAPPCFPQRRPQMYSSSEDGASDSCGSSNNSPLRSRGTRPPHQCRFGASCHNAQCKLIHPSGVSRPFKNCRYGDRCNNPSCTYKHSSRWRAG